MRINMRVEDINATNLARIFGLSISFNNCFCNVLQLVCTRYLDFTACSAVGAVAGSHSYQIMAPVSYSMLG